MSPEQARGQANADRRPHRSVRAGRDRLPHADRHGTVSRRRHRVLLYQVVHEDPPPLSLLRAAGRGTRGRCRPCSIARMAKQPGQRSGGMMELARAFEDAAERTLSRMPAAAAARSRRDRCIADVAARRRRRCDAATTGAGDADAGRPARRRWCGPRGAAVGRDADRAGARSPTSRRPSGRLPVTLPPARWRLPAYARRRGAAPAVATLPASPPRRATTTGEPDRNDRRPAAPASGRRPFAVLLAWPPSRLRRRRTRPAHPGRDRAARSTVSGGRPRSRGGASGTSGRGAASLACRPPAAPAAPSHRPGDRRTPAPPRRRGAGR